MIKKFKDFINLDKRIGKIMITGIEGAGKTLLSAYIAVQKMLRGQLDCWKSFEEVKKYNDLGYSFSTLYEHLVFSNYDINCSGTHIPSFKNYEMNPFRIGLWCEEYDTDFFPPYTCFFVDEAHRPFNAYMWQYVRPEISAFWETSRQGKYDLIMSTNRPGLVVNTIRDLCNRFIHCDKEVEEIVKDGIVVGHKLYIKEFKKWGALESYLKGGQLQDCEEYILVLDKCMYENYKTDNCKTLHLKGRYMQDFYVSQACEISSVEDVENYSDNFGIYAPEGYYYKKGNFDKKKNETEEVEVQEDKFLF